MLKEKQRLVVNNKMELGENISDDAKGKGRKFVSRFIEAGVAHYEEFGDVLITKETLNSFIETMVGCPVIIKHKDIDDQNVDKERVGVVSKVWFNEYDGWFYCEGIIWDKQAIDLIKNQGWSVSCTYDFDTDNQSKTHNGKKIDMEFTGGEFLHLALVPNPRYERANIVMNAKDKVDNDHWIPIGADEEEGKKGRHVKVREGETNKEATERKVAEWKEKDKREEKQSEGKEETKEGKINRYNELQKKLSEIGEEASRKVLGDNYKDKITEEQHKKLEEEANKLGYDKLWKEYSDLSKELNQKDTSDKPETKEEPKKETSDEKSEKSDANKVDFSKYSTEELEQALQSYKSSLGTAIEYGQDQYDTEKQMIDDLSKEIEKRKSEQKTSDKKEDDKKEKDDETKDDDIEWITVKGNHIPVKKGQSKDEAVKEWIEKWKDKDKDELVTVEKADEETIKKNKETNDRWQKAIKETAKKEGWDKEDKKETSDKKEDDKKEKDNKSNNSTAENSKGVTIMSVLKDLEKFVKGVINNADDKEEAKNEDKRKLIDEVGGILKGKVDDEIIKTIMKKMEEASYEPSEDDKADNKAKNEDEEEEEKFEEEKEIADNKAKNEEKEEKEKENEEEKEVKNKCKNSMKDVKKLVMGGSTTVKSSYLSKAERFALGEQY